MSQNQGSYYQTALNNNKHVVLPALYLFMHFGYKNEHYFHSNNWIEKLIVALKTKPKQTETLK